MYLGKSRIFLVRVEKRLKIAYDGVELAFAKTAVIDVNPALFLAYRWLLSGSFARSLISVLLSLGDILKD